MRAILEGGKRGLRDGSIVAGPLDGLRQGARLDQAGDGRGQIRLGDVAIADAPGPEGPVVGRSPVIGEEHRQGELALAEIIADILAERGRGAAVIQRVIDQLEGKAEIGAIGAQGGLIVARPVRQHAPHFPRRRRPPRTAPPSSPG